MTGDIVADADRLAALAAGTDAVLAGLLVPLASGGRKVLLIDLDTLLREAVAIPPALA